MHSGTPKQCPRQRMQRPAFIEELGIQVDCIFKKTGRTKDHAPNPPSAGGRADSFTLLRTSLELAEEGPADSFEVSEVKNNVDVDGGSGTL